MLSSIEKLLKSKRSVFRVSDLAIFWKIKNQDTLKSKIYYLLKAGKIFRVHHGIFLVDKNYDKQELAGKLKNPSYISLETVLRQYGCIFQYSTEITSISNGNKKYKIDRVNFKYQNIKDEVLFNNNGIISKKGYSIATCERAFLDMIYLNKNYYFDNLDEINWGRCLELVKIYKNKSLEKRLENYYKKYVRQK